MKRSIILLLLFCAANGLIAQVRTTRSVSVTRTRIQTEYQYFVRLGTGILNIDDYPNEYGRRSALPIGGVFSWGFRKPFSNSNLSVYWGMEYGITPYSSPLYSHYGNEGAYVIYTSDGNSHKLPSSVDNEYISVYTHALNASPLMLGLELKVAPDVSIDLHAGLGLNMTLFGRYIYDLGDSYNMKHGDGTISLKGNEGDNRRLYCDAQLGLGVWWKKLNLEVTAVANPRNMRLYASVPYNYVTYDNTGNNMQNYTGTAIIRGSTDFNMQLLVRLGIAF